MKDEIDFDIESPLPAWTNELSDELSQRLRKLPPQAFQTLCKLGVEHWNNVAQSVGNSLKNINFTEIELREVLTKSGEAYEDSVTERDIEKVIAKAWDEKSPTKKAAWPLFERAAFEKLPIETEAEILKRFDSLETVEPWGILEKLFSGDPLLCLAEMPREIFQTKKLSEWKTECEQKNFIVPSPMSTRTGITKEGKKSGRCLDNTGERKFLVIESDELNRDDQWILIGHLATIAPLVMILDTGNKSLHAWFRCHEETEEARRSFMAYAVLLGADKATWNRSQLVRLPGGIHAKTGKPHKVLVFRPEAAKNDSWNPDLIPREGIEHFFPKEEICPTLPPGTGISFAPEKIFYAAGEGGYYVDIGSHYRNYGRKTPVKSGLNRFLVEKKIPSDDRKEMIPFLFDQIELDQAVDWTGALAGYRRGVMSFGGRNFLITEAACMADAIEGDCPLHLSIILQAFPDETARTVFLCWLAGAVEAVRAQVHHPSPMLVLAGVPNAGKSLLASIVKNSLGGRSANPMTAWTGQLPWNDDLLGSELLLIDDSVASTDPRARKAFGARFKEAIYAGDVTINTRRKSSISLRPVWRVMVCCNETAENLSVIPPLEEGIEDKIALLRVHQIKTPMPAGAAHEREKFAAALKAELPFFLYYLQRITIPKNLGDSRTGITAWKDPGLLEAVNNIAPEKKLENLIQLSIQRGFFPMENGKRWVSATDLETVITNKNSPASAQAHALLKFHTNAGSYLSALVRRGSAIVTESKKVNGITQYLIESDESPDAADMP